MNTYHSIILSAEEGRVTEEGNQKSSEENGSRLLLWFLGKLLSLLHRMGNISCWPLQLYVSGTVTAALPRSHRDIST